MVDALSLESVFSDLSTFGFVQIGCGPMLTLHTQAQS